VVTHSSKVRSLDTDLLSTRDGGRGVCIGDGIVWARWKALATAKLLGRVLDPESYPWLCGVDSTRQVGVAQLSFCYRCNRGHARYIAAAVTADFSIGRGSIPGSTSRQRKHSRTHAVCEDTAV
jgi:hypothetical protein